MNMSIPSARGNTRPQVRKGLATLQPSFQQPTLVAQPAGVIALQAPSQSQLIATYEGMLNRIRILAVLIEQARVAGYAIYQDRSITYQALLDGYAEIEHQLADLRTKIDMFQVIPAAITPFNAFGNTPSTAAANDARQAAIQAATAKAAEAQAKRDAKIASSNAKKVAAYAKRIDSYLAKAAANPAKAAAYQKAIDKTNLAIQKYGGTPVASTAGSSSSGNPIPTPAGSVTNTNPSPAPGSTMIYPGGNVEPGTLSDEMNWYGNLSDDPLAHDWDYMTYYSPDGLSPVVANVPPVPGTEHEYSPFPTWGPFEFIETQGFITDWTQPFEPSNPATTEDELLDIMDDQYYNKDNIYVESPMEWFISPFGDMAEPVQGFSGIESIIGGLISAGGAIGAAALAPKPPKQVVQSVQPQGMSSSSLMPIVAVGGGLALLTVILATRKR